MVGHIVVVLGVSFVVTFLGCVLMLLLGENWPVRAKFDGRPVAGLALVFGIMPIIWLLPSRLSPFVLCGAATVVVLGVVDDFVNLLPRQKLIGQIVAAGLASFGLGSISVSLPFVIIENQWLVYPCIFSFILLLTNAANLLDGLDGLLIKVIFPSFAALLATSCLEGSLVDTQLAVAVLAAITAFYVFNRSPGRLLLGDTGAEFLGFLLAVVCIVSLVNTGESFSITVGLLIAAVPIIDTALAIGRRLLSGRSILQRDQEHIHHWLAGKFGATAAVNILMSASLLCALIGFVYWLYIF